MIPRTVHRTTMRQLHRGIAIAGAAAVVAAVLAAPAQAESPPGGPTVDQRPLVDAATMLRGGIETAAVAGLASIVIEPNSVALWWKGGQQALPSRVAAVVEQAGTIAPVRVANARFSMSELRSASAKLEERLRANAGFHGIKAKPDGSGLIVKFDASGPAAGAAGPLPEVGVPAAVSLEERLQPISRDNDSSPWSGGAEIINTSIGAGCTSGFGVNVPGGRAILTAGHCGNPGNRITDGAGEFIGNVGGDDNNFDVLVVPTSAVSNRMYVGGGTSTQQRTVTGGGAPFIGERLCQSGNTSANAVGGPICNLQVQFEGTDSQRLWEARQLDGQIAARPGDSGGPVYLDRGDGTVTARGTSTRVAGSGFGFAGFEKAQQRFGVSIPGGGGGRTGPVVSAASGKCLDINASGTADGTKIQIWTCNGTGAQQWTIGTDGTVRGLGKCLDVRSSGTANGTIVHLWSCNGTGAQVWSAQANGSLVNPQSAKCLDVTGNGTANGTQIQIWTCSGGANQRWTLPA